MLERGTSVLRSAGRYSSSPASKATTDSAAKISSCCMITSFSGPVLTLICSSILASCGLPRFMNTARCSLPSGAAMSR
ncbi:hypothetical protein D3C86_1928720 [compost metagenome]